MNDVWTTVARERAALGDDLAGLTDEQWETPSLCTGWTVRDVLAHQTATASLNPATFLVRLAAAGFDFPKFSDRNIQRHLGTNPAATLAEFRSKKDSTSAPPGPKTTWLGEVIVHSEDIRRPLGIRHTYSPGAVRQVIDFYRGSNVLIGTKKRIEGLRLVATDEDWSHGEGPDVRGSLLDLLVAATGRGVACDGLSGDGVATLRERCS